MELSEKRRALRPGFGSVQALTETLRDAGFNKNQVQAFLRCLTEGNQAEQDSILQRQRETLLARLHRTERCIDCLDFLDYQLRRTQSQVQGQGRPPAGTPAVRQ